MKVLQFVFVRHLLAVGLGATTHVAGLEVKLVGAPDGMRNKARMAADIVTDSIIIGAHPVGFLNMDGFANICTRNRSNKWEQTGKVLAGDRNKEKLG